MNTAINNFQIGDNVVFGRPNGQEHTGVITKVNSTTYKINSDYVKVVGNVLTTIPNTSVRVSKKLVRPAVVVAEAEPEPEPEPVVIDETPPPAYAPVERNEKPIFKVGDEVSWTVRKQVCRGTITKVNKTTYKIEGYNSFNTKNTELIKHEKVSLIAVPDVVPAVVPAVVPDEFPDVPHHIPLQLITVGDEVIIDGAGPCWKMVVVAIVGDNAYMEGDVLKSEESGLAIRRPLKDLTLHTRLAA